MEGTNKKYQQFEIYPNAFHNFVLCTPGTANFTSPYPIV